MSVCSARTTCTVVMRIANSSLASAVAMIHRCDPLSQAPPKLACVFASWLIGNSSFYALSIGTEISQR